MRTDDRSYEVSLDGMPTRKIVIRPDGRVRKFYRSAMAILLIALLSLTSFSGCGSSKKSPTPEQKEEQRQKMIQNAERQRREG
jgi:hypothetical protein